MIWRYKGSFVTYYSKSQYLNKNRISESQYDVFEPLFG